MRPETLERAVNHKQLREEVKRLRTAVRDSQSYTDMIGTSAPTGAKINAASRPAGAGSSEPPAQVAPRLRAILDLFYADEALRRCKACGTVHPGRAA